MRSQLLDAKLSIAVIWNVILKTARVYLFAFCFVTILFVLQWLFNIDQLLEVVFGDNALSFSDRAEFLVDGFINIFRYADDIVPISMILIALMQAVAVTLLISFRSIKKLQAQQGQAVGFAVFGVGCVACGGSILTPILGLVATNVSVGLAESISNILLVIALVLSYVAMNKVSFMVAKEVTSR